MRRISSARALGLAALLCAAVAGAADHQDGAAVLTDPASDINDVFAWTSPDGSKLNLVMDVFPFATTAARFSDVVQYVFHTSSSAGYGMATGASEDIICTFDSSQMISCWGAGEYVHGNASTTGGVARSHGEVEVFPGLPGHPFLLHLARLE